MKGEDDGATRMRSPDEDANVRYAAKGPSPASVLLRRALGSLKAWVSRPPRLRAVLALACISGVVVYAVSRPAGLLELLISDSWAWIILAVVLLWPGGVILVSIDYLAHFIGCAIQRRIRARCWRWYPAPLLVLLAVTAWRSQWPLQLRFNVGHRAFEAAAAELLAGPATAHENTSDEIQHDVSYPMFRDYGKRVGTYHIASVAVFPDEKVVYLLTGGFFRAGWGFVYNPNRHTLYMYERPLAPGWSEFAFDRY